MTRADILNFLVQCRAVVLGKSTLDQLTEMYESKGQNWDAECNAHVRAPPPRPLRSCILPYLLSR